MPLPAAATLSARQISVRRLFRPASLPPAARLNIKRIAVTGRPVIIYLLICVTLAPGCHPPPARTHFPITKYIYASCHFQFCSGNATRIQILTRPKGFSRRFWIQLLWEFNAHGDGLLSKLLFGVFVLIFYCGEICAVCSDIGHRPWINENRGISCFAKFELFLGFFSLCILKIIYLR